MDIKSLNEMVVSEDALSRTGFADNGASLVNENELLPITIRHPYYLETFLFIISEVLKDPSYHKLFDDADRIYADKFLNLPGLSLINILPLIQIDRKYFISFSSEDQESSIV